MHATVLIRIHSVSRAPRAALRFLLHTARTLRELPGFRRWQTFRAMDSSDTLLVLLDWDSPEQYAAAARLAATDLSKRLAAWGMQSSPPEVVSSAFDRRLTEEESAATLLRASRTDAPCRGAASRDNDLALRALAAPATTRVQGGRNAEGTTTLCRIDFDTEDGIWHFLESPLRRTWSHWCEQGYEEETWAINLPRLEYQRPAAVDRRRPAMEIPPDSLCVQFSLSEDKQAATLRLQGRVDASGSAHCEKLCETLLTHGLRRLEVDVSGLSRISPETLQMLARTARHLKERGGQFVLVDNEARVKRVTRSKHLEASVR